MRNTTVPLSDKSVLRLTQRGTSVARELAANLREYHAIERELRSRYPNILWPTVNEIIDEFWQEVD